MLFSAVYCRSRIKQAEKEMLKRPGYIESSEEPSDVLVRRLPW